MNRYAYRTTGLAIKTLSKLSRANISVHGAEHIPDGALIFAINHFTRIETLLLPYYINQLTHKPIWSLADKDLFNGSMGTFLDRVGAVSTQNPDRDLLIVRTLLTGDSAWIIYPEGRMVKNKKIVNKGRFMISSADGWHRPHTGVSALALRAEFYRKRLRAMADDFPEEGKRLMGLFGFNSLDPILDQSTYVVPVNVTYYPLRAHENILNGLAARMVDELSDRMVEEIMTEGTMLISGVDMDIRFGKAIEVGRYLEDKMIRRDITARKPINFDDPIESKNRMRQAADRIMERYMASIYRMTTVNHDHIFASLLRASLSGRIHTETLIQRGFLAADRILDMPGIFCHQSLRGDQCHLLTDDRFQKFSDFLSIALEKKIFRRENGQLVLDSQRLNAGNEFHRARIDNPVAVMANEVEPLSSLQRSIRRLAWTPGFLLRRKIAMRLLKKDFREFEDDYRQYYVAGESHLRQVGRPTLIKGRSRKIGVLLIHGYMAAPMEVGELAESLGKRGFWVYSPRLKGHGTSPDDLAVRTFMDWVESVDRGYAIMSCMCQHVVVGGFSMGAGLALDLAARIKNVAGVFAVCPPLQLQEFSSKFVPAVDAWNRLMKKIRLDEAQKEFVENNPENPHINYFRNPISGVRQLDRFMRTLEPRLPRVDVPALVAQSSGDPVVSQRGSKRVFDLLGSKDKAYTLLNFDRHGILLGDGACRVHDVIGDFIENFRKTI